MGQELVQSVDNHKVWIFLQFLEIRYYAVKTFSFLVHRYHARSDSVVYDYAFVRQNTIGGDGDTRQFQNRTLEAASRFFDDFAGFYYSSSGGALAVGLGRCQENAELKWRVNNG